MRPALPSLQAHIQYMLSKGKGKRGRPGPEQTGAVPADITQVCGCGCMVLRAGREGRGWAQALVRILSCQAECT
jgi:hypothetical protein